MSYRRAISTTKAVILIVVIVCVAGAAIYVTSTLTAPTPSMTTTTAAASPTLAQNSTLVIDDYLWSSSGTLNQLDASFFFWPDWLGSGIYQTLVAYNLTAEQKFGQIQFLPDLATNWTISPDMTTYTFSMRSGVSFSDGNPCNAYSFWADFYILHYLAANLTTFWNSLSIFDFSNVNFGPSTLSLMSQSGLVNPSPQLVAIMSNSSWPVYAPNPSTLVWHMEYPYLWALNVIAGGELGFVFDPTYVMQHGGPGTASAINPYFNTNVIPGTGPYEVTQVILNELMKCVKNPNYWGDNLTSSEIAANPMLDPGHYNTVLVQYKSSDTVRYIDLTTNKAQIASILTSDFQLLRQNPSYSFYQLPAAAGGAQVERIAFNLNKYPTNITDLRLAIAYAINYTSIIQNVLYGYGSSWVGPEAPMYGQFYNPSNSPGYNYNLTLAKEYLAKAGFPGGSGLPTLSLAIDEDGAFYEEPMAEIVQSDLAQIGIQTNIIVETYVEYYQYLGSYQTVASSSANLPNMVVDDPLPYSPDFVAPDDYWTHFVYNGSYFGNYAGYSNPIVNNAVTFMTHSDNTTAITQQLAVAQQQIQLDCPYAWVFVQHLPLTSGSYVYNNDVISGFYGDPNVEGAIEIPMINTVVPAS